MSYCRWSTDDFQCDLYCYESSEGWMTHVAGNRVHWKVDLPPDVEIEFFKNGRVKKGAISRHTRRWVQVMRLLDDESNYDRKPIGLEYDGASFCDDSPEDWLLTLEMLRGEGYRFPTFVIDNAKEESRLSE